MGGIFDPIHMSDKSRGANQEYLRQIVITRRSRGGEADWSAILG